MQLLTGGDQCMFSLPFRSTVRDRILAPNEDKNDWALTWWALADVKNTSVPPGEFRMSYAKGRAVYYGEVSAKGVECEFQVFA